MFAGYSEDKGWRELTSDRRMLMTREGSELLLLSSVGAHTEVGRSSLVQDQMQDLACDV